MNFKENRSLYRLQEITEYLRSEKGCPWDREQDSMSLRKYLVEETYEVIDAIESRSNTKMVEELGDLLYQIYAHAQIADESGAFDIDDVADGITDKLIRRHPHVFGSEVILDGEGVADRWEKIKKEEKKGNESILSGIPAHLPALLKAFRAQEKAARIGFDWSEVNDVEKKLEEEIGEFRQAVSSGDKESVFEEFGDILFTLVNLSRHIGIDPEDALQQSTKKFISRFRIVEESAKAGGKELSDMDLSEMDSLWNKAKSILKNRNGSEQPS